MNLPFGYGTLSYLFWSLYLKFFLRGGFPEFQERTLKDFSIDHCSALAGGTWEPKLPQKPCHWVHLSSFGESKLLIALMDNPLFPFKRENLLVTVQTPTAHLHLTKTFPGVFIRYAPMDVPKYWKLFYKIFQPKTLWILETEIWPALLNLAFQKGMATSLVHARINPATARLSWLFSGFFKKISQTLRVFPIDKQSHHLYKKIFPDAIFKPLPSLKWAVRPQSEPLKLTLPEDKILVILGSFQSQEIEWFFNLISRVKKERLKPFRFLVVPRHSQLKNRGGFLKQLQSLQFDTKVIDTLPVTLEIKHDVTYFEPMGHLDSLYQWGDLVLVGGGFLPHRGGQNPLEPLFYKKPVFFGPFMENFKWATQPLLEKKGAFRGSLPKGVQWILDFPNNREKYHQQGEKGYKLLKNFQNISNQWCRSLQKS